MGLLALLFVGYQLWPLLAGVEPAGWDMSGHLYLYQRFVVNLRAFTVFAYDFNWGGGFPEFYLYPPGAYLWLALPHFASFGVISELYSFNLGIVLTALAVFGTSYFLGTAFFGSKAGTPAVLFASFLLATPPEYDYLGIGLGGAISSGLLPNFIVLPFFILMLAFLERHRTREDSQSGLIAGALLTSIFYIHLITFLFSLWVWGWYFIASRPKERLRILLFAFLAALACLPLLIPMLRHLPYSSGAKAGIWGDSADPLFPLLSGLTPSRIIDSFRRAFESLPAVPTAAASGLPPVWSPVRVPFLLAYFPYAGIVILFTGIIGVTALLRERKFLIPLCYLTSLIFLPRNFLSQDLDVPIHYYRFIQAIGVLQIVICTRGAIAGAQWLIARDNPSRPRVGMIAATFTILFAVLFDSFLNFSLSHRSLLRDAEAKPYRSYFTIDSTKYRSRSDADQLMNDIAALRPWGRVAVETSGAQYTALGSPHFIASELPRRFGIPTVPGLIAESMLSTPFINPILMQRSEHLSWADVSLATWREFYTQTLEEHLEKLRLFSVQYIVTSSPKYMSLLRSPKLDDSVIARKRYGRFGLFELRSPRPLAETPRAAPMLVLGLSEREFLDLSRRWITDNESLDYPLIFTPKRFDRLSSADQQSVGGFVLPEERLKNLSLGELAAVNRTGRPVLLLNTRGAVFPPGALPPTYQLVSYMPEMTGTVTLRNAIKAASIPIPQAPPILKPLENGRSVEFQGHGATVLRVSYGPDWRVEGSDRTVFWATPCQLLVFGDGIMRLRYGGSGVN